VEFVQTGVVAVTGELNLELHLVSLHRHAAHRTWSADAWPTPSPIRPTTREFSVLDYLASDLAKNILFHLASPWAHDFRRVNGKGSSQMPGGPTPDAPVGGPVEGDGSLSPNMP